MSQDSKDSHVCGLARFSGENLKLRTPEEIYYSCSCCAHLVHDTHKSCSWMCGCASPIDRHTSDATECYPYYYQTCAIPLHNAIGLKSFLDVLALINAGADPDQRCFIHGNAITALVKHEYNLNMDFYDKFNYLIYDMKVDVKTEENRGRNPLYIVLTHRYFFKERKKFKDILMPLTFKLDETTKRYDLKDMFKVCLLETILAEGGDRTTIDTYYRLNNIYFNWIEKLWTLDKGLHILSSFLHESIQNIANYEFEYMKFLEVQRKIFKALSLLYSTLKGKRKRLFYQILYRLIKIGLPTLRDRYDDDKYNYGTDRFDKPHTFKRLVKGFMLDVPLSSGLFNHLNGLYYVNPDFELDYVFVDLYHEFNNFRDYKTRIDHMEQKLLDFLFPFVTPAGMQKMLDYRIQEGDRYDTYARYSILDCFENYADRFFPFELYKKAATLKCTFRVQPFSLKRISRDVIRSTVFKHDCDPNRFIKNINSLKCLPKTLRWYLRFVLPSYKII